MVVGSLGVLGVTGDLGGPVQQGDVHEAVDDQTVVVGCTDGAPCLDELVTGVVALHELVSGQDACTLCLLGAGQLVAGDTGDGVQEAQIVVIQLDAVLDTVQESIDVLLGADAEGLIAGVLIAQPQQAGPEAVGPLDAVNDGVLQALGGRPGEPGAEVIHIGAGLSHNIVHGLLHLSLGQQRSGQVFLTELNGFDMEFFDHS